MVPLTETNEGLSEILTQLAPHDRISVDTEADSLHCYFEKLCLIQISVPGADFLVDPLAPIDLAPLWKAWEGKELVFHGADYDLRLLRRSGCPMPTRLFDTMLAARLTGATEFSYAALMERYYQIKIPKSSQKANWARRPLPQQMIDYAVNDTRHLEGIREILNGDLDRMGRRDWFDQCCDRSIRAALVDKEHDPDQIWRISGSGVLRGRAAAIFRELWHWREEEARMVDKPTFHILNGELMIKAAEDFHAGSRVEFKHIRGPRAKRMFEAAKRGILCPEADWPKIIRNPRTRPSQQQYARFLELKKARDTKAHDLKLDPSLIAAKATLEGLAFRPEDTQNKLMPWQRELLGL